MIEIKPDWTHLKMGYAPTHFSQMELIKMMVSSMSYKDMATARGVSESSISSCACILYRNTGARDRFELCVWALKKGYVNIQ